MSWQVLDWNEPAIKFYEKTGILDFETEAFHRDIKALFWAEGWLDETLSKK